MASSIFFFLSSISSGVSMPAGTDEKPPGVISPLGKTKWHTIHVSWFTCVHFHESISATAWIWCGVNIQPEKASPNYTYKENPIKASHWYLYRWMCVLYAFFNLCSSIFSETQFKHDHNSPVKYLSAGVMNPVSSGFSSSLSSSSSSSEDSSSEGSSSPHVVWSTSSSSALAW